MPMDKEGFCKRKVFGLTEVVVGLFILATIFGGLLASFVGVRRYINHASRRIDAINIARAYLNSWVGDVRADTWNLGSNPLSLGVDKSLNPAPPAPYNSSATKYSVKTGSSPTAGSYYREVQITIAYPYD